MDPNPALTIRYGEIDAAYADRLASTPAEDDGPVWMVNLMAYRDRAEYADGRPTTLTGQEADDRYTPLGPLAAVGAQIVFAGDVDTQLLGDSPQWHRVAVVRYPTRRAFVDLQAHPDFVALHEHKDAGMAHTFVIGCRPLAAPDLPADAPSWDDVPHPPTDQDPSVAVVHVLRYHGGWDGSGDEMSAYTDHAARIAVPHGVRVGGWFDVEGTIIGDGRSWDQVRFNLFPSREAFMAVVLDPDRLAAQRDHREVAIADTYTMIVRPFLDRLRESFTW